MIHHSAALADLKHDFAAVCEVIAIASLVANFLPKASYFAPFPRFKYWYVWFVDMVAAFALNIRICIPSLDQEFMGFRRKVRHGYRNWQQRRADRQYRRIK